MVFNEENNLLRVIILFFVHAIVVISIAWFVVFGVGFGTVCSGQSMQPTMEPGDTVIVDRISYHFRMPERFDVILFISEDAEALTDKELEEKEPDIKRIVGLPGESVHIADGQIFINGRKLQENLSFGGASLAGLAAEDIVLEENEYFVLGDNRVASEDSRFDNVGNVNRNQIIGKVWFRTSPVSRMGRIE